MPNEKFLKDINCHLEETHSFIMINIGGKHKNTVKMFYVLFYCQNVICFRKNNDKTKQNNGSINF